MPYTWYVTFEVQKRGVLPRRRSPRATRNFETETEAKDFARAKFNEGLIVYAGTINQAGTLQVRAERLGKETTFGKIIEVAMARELFKDQVQSLAMDSDWSLIRFFQGFCSCSSAWRCRISIGLLPTTGMAQPVTASKRRTASASFI